MGKGGHICLKGITVDLILMIRHKNNILWEGPEKNMQIWHVITQVWVGDKVNIRFLHILKCCTFTFSLWWKPIWWVETRNIDVNKQHSTSYGDQKWGDLGGLHSNKSRPELTVSRLTARNAIRVATRIVMFLVWPRPELSCVVTRNETLSGYRYYMVSSPIKIIDKLINCNQ